MRVVDAHGSWQKVTQPITLGGFTENDRKQSVVCGSSGTNTPLWKARTKTRPGSPSAAYQNGKPETTPTHNGTTVADGRITSSQDVGPSRVTTRWTFSAR